MVKSKPSRPYKVNKLNTPTEGNKEQASKPDNYRGKKPRNKPSLEPESKTDFQVRCTDLEGYIMTLGQEHPKFSPKQ